MFYNHFRRRIKKLIFLNIPIGFFSILVSFTFFSAIEDRIPLWLNTVTCLLGAINYYFLLKNYPIKSYPKLFVHFIIYLICLISYASIIVIFFITLVHPNHSLASKTIYIVIGFQLIDSTEHFLLKIVDGKMKITLFNKNKRLLGGAMFDVISRNYNWIKNHRNEQRKYD